jgi:hypothetical protein
LLVTLVVVAVGGACAPDGPASRAIPTEGRLAGYATMHDTMPEAIHQAKHAAVERPTSDIARSKSMEGLASQLVRIAGTNDAWLDFELRRRPDGDLAAVTDTVTMLMNCNADSLVVLDQRARPLTNPVVLPPGVHLHFREGHARVRVYGMRALRPGQRSETLVRTARGGDLVLRTPLTSH